MKKIVIANWKMNPATFKEVVRLFGSVAKGVRDIKNVEVVIAPPFIYLSQFTTKLAAQDMFWEERGAYTGEISPMMLRSMGVEYVIVGHSERRALGETDEMVNKKLKAALKARLTPILCIGEQDRKQFEKTLSFLREQLKKDFSGVKPELARRVIIAYEPIWAIGTGMAENADDANKIAVYIRRVLQELVGVNAARSVRIIYGGSVSPKNASSFIAQGVRGMEGLLVGGASLKADEFVKIVKSVAAVS